MGLKQLLSLQFSLDLGVIAQNFPNAPELKPHPQMVKCYILDTRWWSLTPLQSMYSVIPADWAGLVLRSLLCNSSPLNIH